jgi:hypothetical protein
MLGWKTHTEDLPGVNVRRIWERLPFQVDPQGRTRLAPILVFLGPLVLCPHPA